MLGDAVHEALSRAGISPAAVERLLGRPCHCPERQEALNALHLWAVRVLRGHVENAESYLWRVLGAANNSDDRHDG
jgi:hypothetical protein